MKIIKKSMSILMILTMIISLFTIIPFDVSAAGSKAEQYLSAMTTEDKISMMIMPVFRYSIDENGDRINATEITEDIAASLQEHSYSGVILMGQNTPTNAGATRLVDALQKANLSGGERPQLLISIDQEGGNVTRLAQGTMTPGNMALGAINDIEVTKEVATMIGSELKAIGINADFAPDVDINNNPANPIIGVRSFSDDPQLVAAHGSAFVEALNNTGVISTLKHFPGHGDTDTDSHTGLPCINKTYEELKQNELIPFQACIDAGSQMIMTAHIVYPQIETNTYISKLTGEEINLPATLSKTIITDILRGDMGYDGVVVTDAMEMDAIAKHFDRYDAAKLAIEAGVDILLMPFDPTTKEDFAALDAYISTIAQMADNGDISMDTIDAAVLRILKLKENNGLFEPYDGSDIESRVQNAIDTVGTKESHDKEWEITKKAITLVKNDNNTLPLTKENQKTVVLVPYDNETIPMDYAVRKLIEDGKLPEGAVVEAYSYRNKAVDDVLPMVEGADNIVFMSEIYGAYALKNDTAKMADTLADTIHEKGGRFIVMSVNLPYDAARFSKADAIMIAYLARSMPVDPGDKVREMQQYGPNMPVALYMMFSEEDGPTAQLPINIPELDDAYNYTDAVLYERGCGLTYNAALLGDVDGDGEVSIVDATFIQRRLADIPLRFEINKTVADTDEDNDLTIIDATFIQRWLAHLPSNENIGKPITHRQQEDNMGFIQSIPLNSIQNARELGGYKTTDGKTVKSGVLLRTAALHDISDEDIRTLTEVYRVQQIIDFRMALEMKGAEDPAVTGAEYRHLDVIGFSFMDGLEAAPMDLNTVDLNRLLELCEQFGMLDENMYVKFLKSETGKAAYSEFFRILLDADPDRAVLWHCTSGKDRTGVAAMLLLSALGVDEDLIIKDYLLTNECNAQRIAGARQYFKAQGYDDAVIDKAILAFNAVDERFMRNAFGYLNEEYGSVVEYIRDELNISQNEIDTLKEKYLI